MYQIYLLMILVIISFFGNCKEKKDKKEKEFLLLGAVAAANSGGGGQGTPETVATPTFSPAEGTHSNTPLNLTISTTTSGANIYFSTDGNNPTTSSNLYSTPVHIWFLAGKTVKAFATKTGFTDSAVATLTGVFSYPPLKTGQTNSYFTTGSDGDLQKGVARSYTDNGDGTVTDKATGLVWQKCSRGQNNDASCTGTATASNWSTAVSYCGSLTLAGKTWRLPNINELKSIVDTTKTTAPAIDTTIFPSTVASDSYWSSTTFASNTSSAWVVISSDGQITIGSKTNNFYVRCVSGL